jgi:hypothetical protein
MHGFEVRQPKSFPNAKMSRPNVFTIGAAYYYALKSVRSEYMLFMENDFKMDVTLSRERVASELIASAGLLQRGTEIVRLLSRKGQVTLCASCNLFLMLLSQLHVCLIFSC